jgi:hypothetical protein
MGDTSKDCLIPSFVKMAAAYLEINKLPCFHEIDIIPKCIKLGVIGFFVLLFLICF